MNIAVPSTPAYSSSTVATGTFASNTQVTVRTYLTQQFDSIKTFLLTRATTDAKQYGAAYKHCLLERNVQDICAWLGIAWPLNRGTGRPVTIDNLTISLIDIVGWLGCCATETFCNIRSSVARSRVALERLTRTASLGPLPPSDESARNILFALLISKPLTPPVVGSNLQMELGQLDAMSLSNAKWVSLVADILTRYLF